MTNGMIASLLIMAMTTAVFGQQTPETPVKTGPFILELTDEEINQLKSNSEGLIAHIPEYARGHITHVVLKYKPPDTSPQVGSSPAATAPDRSPDYSVLNQGATNRRTDSNTTPLDSISIGNNRNPNSRTAPGQQVPTRNNNFQLPAKQPSNQNEPWYPNNQNGSPDGGQDSVPNLRSDPRSNGLLPQFNSSSGSSSQISGTQSQNPPSSLRDEIDREIALINSRRMANERAARQLELQQQQLASQWRELDRWQQQRRQIENQQQLGGLDLADADYGPHQSDRSGIQTFGKGRYAMRDDSSLGRHGPIIENPTNRLPNRLGEYSSQLVNQNSDSYRMASARSSATQLPLPTTGPMAGPPPASINGPQQNGTGLPATKSNPAGSMASPLGSAGMQAANKANGFLWFMLLCSIGLNFYLSWIARGFYMRYAELADELRETFTSTT